MSGVGENFYSGKLFLDIEAREVRTNLYRPFLGLPPNTGAAIVQLRPVLTKINIKISWITKQFPRK